MRIDRQVLRNMLALMAIFVVATWVSNGLLAGVDRVRLVWLPSGVAFAALALFGLRYWPGVVLAVVLSELTRWFVQPEAMLLSIVHNTVPAVLAAAVYRQLQSRLRPHVAVFRVYALMLAAVTVALLSAVTGSLALALLHLPASDRVWLDAMGKFALSSFFGVILVAPTWVVLHHRAEMAVDRNGMAGAVESLLWLFALFGVAAYVLLTPAVSFGRPVYLMTLPLLWSALRLPPAVTTISTAATILGLLVTASNGWFGFEPITGWQTAMYVIAFLLAYSLVPLFVMSLTQDLRGSARRMLAQARTDELTGLPNRVGFSARFREVLAQHPNASFALLYIDIDNFKLVNDVASHAAGDTLIRALAGVVRGHLSPRDVIARTGGDEFALLLVSVRGESVQTLAERIRQAVALYRHQWDGGAFATTCSIGVVAFDSDHANYDALLAKADAGCFSAKSAGGNRVVVVSPDPEIEDAHTQSMRAVLRIERAIERDDFVLYCQSIVPLADRGETRRHYEVLLRKRDPETGRIVPPDEFIPAVERFNLGPRLDQYVLDRVLRCLEANPAWCDDTALCGINLTAASVENADFLAFVRERLKRSTVPANRLCFEITEGSAVRDLGDARRFIEAMRALGCRIALDDFGTGFCSFAYLGALPVDYVKIDGSFVREIAHAPLALSIVRSITDIARSAAFTTIAEFVEDEAIRAQLVLLGVDFAQGYAIDKPQPIESYFTAATPGAAVATEPAA